MPFSLMLFMGILTGCVLPWMEPASVPAKKGTEVFSDPSLIQSIWMDSGTEGPSLWIAGSRDLVFSAMRRPDPPSLSLYFPQTVLHVPGPIPVEAPVARLRAYSSDSREKTVVVEMDLSQAADFEIRRHPGSLQVLFQKKEASPKEGAPKRPLRIEASDANRFSVASGTRVQGADVRIFEDHARIRVLADGPIQDYNTFIVKTPPRIVFDLFYMSIGADAQPFEPENSRYFRRMAWEVFPDRVRVVIETDPEWLDSYQAQPVAAGLLVRIGKEGGGPQSAPAQGANALPWSAAPPTMETAGVRISRIDISCQTGGKVTLSLSTTRPAMLRIDTEDERHLLVKLSGVLLPENFSDLVFDNGSVRIAPLSDRRDALFSIQLSRPVPYYVEQEKDRVSVHFRAPAKGAPKAGKESLPLGETAANESVRDFLGNWLRSWEKTAGREGQLEPYMAHYSENFKCGQLDKTGWRRDKEKKNKERQWISGQLKDLQVSKPEADGSVRVRFLLDYNAPDYSEVLEKEMTLARESGRWKIVSEETRLQESR